MKTPSASTTRIIAIMTMTVCLAVCSVNRLWAGVQPSPFLDLIDQVCGLDLSRGIENSLVTKVDGALKKHEAGKLVPVINKLEAFNNQVDALRAVHIEDRDADALIAAAEDIIESHEDPGPR